MANSNPGNLAKAFLRDVHEDVKDYASNNGFNFIYTYSFTLLGSITNRGTGVDRSFPIGSFLRSKYGYASAVDRSYSLSSYSAMRRDLIDYNLPGIISGESSDGVGHTWICDGYHYHCEHWYDVNNEPFAVVSTYLHYCWGQSDTSIDGWYSTSNALMFGIDYKYDMTLTYHISPVDYWDY